MGLAGPKKKVRYSIDPNALHWAKSEDKFGKRMLEKMGWTAGKGLGAKEDGMVDNIKVKFKGDTQGLGFNPKDYDNVWQEHIEGYEAILKNLSQPGDEKEATSAEEEAQNEIQEEKEEEETECKDKSKKKKKKKKSKSSSDDESQVESVVEPAKQAETESLDTKINKSFKGSNLASIFGYSSYVVNTSVDELIKEKSKRADRKRSIVDKILDSDTQFTKKKKC